MVQAARTMQEDGKAIGTYDVQIPHTRISSYEGVVPKTTNWRELGDGSEAPSPSTRQEQLQPAK
jgi:phthalate 4,5-dioxygenase oxygenase subunit